MGRNLTNTCKWVWTFFSCLALKTFKCTFDREKSFFFVVELFFHCQNTQKTQKRKLFSNDCFCFDDYNFQATRCCFSFTSLSLAPADFDLIFFFYSQTFFCSAVLKGDEGWDGDREKRFFLFQWDEHKQKRFFSINFKKPETKIDNFKFSRLSFTEFQHKRDDCTRVREMMMMMTMILYVK